MNKVKTFLISLITACFLTTATMAFEGFSIGVTGHQADFETTGSQFDDSEATTTGSAAKSVDYGSIFLEYTLAQGTTIGVDYIPGDAEIGAKSRTDSETATGRDSGTYTAKASISDHYTFYVEPTIMSSDTVGWYVKGGATKVTVQSQESLAIGTDSSTYGDVDVWGVMYGVGAKFYMGNWFAKLEHTQTEYGTVTLNSTTGNGNTISADPEMDQTSLSLGYNF
tara:strand:- start:151 stop:822 length:672 start_codon:yes stop_codon:yes gene_type:complete